MIETIIFDLGGVLVPEKGSLINGEIARYLGITSTKLSEISIDLKSKSTIGEITLLEVYSEIVGRLGKEIDPQDLFDNHLELYERNCTKRNSKIIELVERLKNKYQVVCLTNTEIEIAKFNRDRGLFDYFDRSYISTEIGLLKPDEKIYLKVLSDLRISTDKVLFIDDKQEFVKGAERIGIKSIRYQNFDQLINEMSSLDIV